MADNRIWIGGAGLALLLAGVAYAAAASYPAMAPRSQYMIANRAEEIALARSAAPPSISGDAGVMVLGAHGFVTAVKGTNGFVCFVERSWDKPFDDPEFWNPKMRGPDCLNAAAVRTVLPIYLERARWVLAGFSLDKMKKLAPTSAAARQTPAPGAMSYMMSKEQYLSDAGGNWHPHIMFFTPPIDPHAWGANMEDSPVFGTTNPHPLMVFFVPVPKWSDGTLADYGAPPESGAPHRH